MEEKTITIPLTENRKITMLFTRPRPTATWVCQASDEALSDMQNLLEGLSIALGVED